MQQSHVWGLTTSERPMFWFYVPYTNMSAEFVLQDSEENEIYKNQNIALRAKSGVKRLMALYEISEGQSATQVGKQTKRNPKTVMKWVHRYNQEGLVSTTYFCRITRPSCFAD